MATRPSDLSNYYDEDGRLKQYPRKRRELRAPILDALAEGFAVGERYTEKEVNARIAARIAFSDVETLRRELIDTGRLSRLRDGSQYWREPTPIEN